MTTTTAPRRQDETPQMVSLRNQYSFARSSVWRFDTPFLLELVEKHRAQNRAAHEAGTLRPADLVYLRACLDTLADRGVTVPA